MSNYEKGNRVIVNLGTKKSPEYYLGKIIAMKKDFSMYKVKFDDGDEGTVDPKDILGLTHCLSHKQVISADKIDKYILKCVEEPEVKIEYKVGDRIVTSDKGSEPFFTGTVVEIKNKKYVVNFDANTSTKDKTIVPPESVVGKASSKKCKDALTSENYKMYLFGYKPEEETTNDMVMKEVTKLFTSVTSAVNRINALENENHSLKKRVEEQETIIIELLDKMKGLEKQVEKPAKKDKPEVKKVVETAPAVSTDKPKPVRGPNGKFIKKADGEANELSNSKEVLKPIK